LRRRGWCARRNRGRRRRAERRVEADDSRLISRGRRSEEDATRNAEACTSVRDKSKRQRLSTPGVARVEGKTLAALAAPALNPPKAGAAAPPPKAGAAAPNPPKAGAAAPPPKAGAAAPLPLPKPPPPKAGAGAPAPLPNALPPLLADAPDAGVAPKALPLAGAALPVAPKPAKPPPLPTAPAAAGAAGAVSSPSILSSAEVLTAEIAGCRTPNHFAFSGQ